MVYHFETETHVPEIGSTIVNNKLERSEQIKIS